MITATANLQSTISVTAQIKSVQVGNCAPATVENSDGTVSVTVPSGGTEEFPDTPISANSELIVNQPSGVSKNLVVRYETLGVAPTTIVSGEVVVPDSIQPDPNRNPFTGNYGYLNAPNSGFQADGYGCLQSFYRWTTEPITAQDCTVEFYAGKLIANGCLVGFCEQITATTNFNDNIRTGFYANGPSAGQFFVGGVYIGQFYVPSAADAVFKVTWNATDGKFRFYLDDVLIYTSTYTKFGGVYPALASTYGNQPIAGCFVTRKD